MSLLVPLVILSVYVIAALFWLWRRTRPPFRKGDLLMDGSGRVARVVSVRNLGKGWTQIRFVPPDFPEGR